MVVEYEGGEFLSDDIKKVKAERKETSIVGPVGPTILIILDEISAGEYDLC